MNGKQKQKPLNKQAPPISSRVMKLLITLFCLSAASAMTNERKPTIAIDSNASSSFGDVLLQAKASTFLEMAGSTDDHYALLESLNIDPGVFCFFVLHLLV